MYLKKSKVHPFIAIRYYVNFFIDEDIFCDYLNNCISERQWIDLRNKIDNVQKSIDKKKNEDLVPGTGVIGRRTAEIVAQYLRAEIRPHKMNIGEPEKRRLLFKLEKLTAKSPQKREKDIALLLHQPSVAGPSVIPEENTRQWIDALNHDIRCIDLKPIYKIVLICGRDVILVDNIFASLLDVPFPEVQSRPLQLS